MVVTLSQNGKGHTPRPLSVPRKEFGERFENTFRGESSLSKTTQGLEAIDHLRKKMHFDCCACDDCKKIWERIAAIQLAMQNTKPGGL